MREDIYKNACMREGVDAFLRFMEVAAEPRQTSEE